MIVDQLTPGMAFATKNVDGKNIHSVFVGRLDHPLYPTMRMIIWRHDDTKQPWSHAAADPHQDVGTPIDQPPVDRRRNLTWAILGGNHKMADSTKKVTPPR